jgi:hypothetical protein
MASDSRLSGGQAMDYGQKVFQMPRTDALFAFAGDTQYAYPLLMQMLRAVEGYPFSADRRLPLPKLKGHTLRVFQQTYAAIHSLPVGQPDPDPPDNFFLLGGFDWQTHIFRAWRLSFDRGVKQFTYRPVVGPDATSFFFAGDDGRAVKEAIVRTRKRLGATKDGMADIDMEPFEVLCEIIDDPEYRSIGGAPQLAKVYAHLNTQLFQVIWQDGTSRVPHVAGRPLLPGERSVLPAYDPQRGFYSVREADSQIDKEAGAG